MTINIRPAVEGLCIGFMTGFVLGEDPGIFAGVLMISNIANSLVFKAANQWIRPLMNRMQKYVRVTNELTYAVTCVCVSTVTCLALNHLELLSRRLTGMFVICSLAAFAGRLHIIYGG